LFISGGISESWQRTVEGARDAARDLGVELQVKEPTADNCPDEQSAMLRAINLTECDGVAFCPADPESQLELVSEIAEQTKLVTIGNYFDRSNALCHVGYSPSGVAVRVARLILDELPRGGKIAVLSSRHTKGNRNTLADMQLNDFKEQWGGWDGPGSSMLRSIVADVGDNGEVTQHAGSVVSTALLDPDIAYIFAFDSPSVECALAALAEHPRTKPIPIIAATDPTAAILDAIGAGHIYAAVSKDPYHNGYEGVVRAAKLCQCDVTETLPAPGHGSVFIPAQIVQKANLANFRRSGQARAILAIRPKRSKKAPETRAVVQDFQSAERS
jgi:ABC-type sugar transport system substrate-binding protein